MDRKMREIKEFQCTYNNEEVQRDTSFYYQLPGSNTLEAEALGADIKMCDGEITSRVNSYVYSSLEELLKLPEIDYQKSHMAELLNQCKELRTQGKNVMLNVSGPLTILSSLIDSKYVFKAMKRNPELLLQILEKLRMELVRFVEQAISCDVNMLSFADPVGGVSILGPKYTKFMVDSFTVPFLKEVWQIVEGKAQIFLCPKTSFALYGTENADWRDVAIPEPKKYVEAAFSVKEKAPIVGQMCVKNRDYVVQNTIKALDINVLQL